MTVPLSASAGYSEVHQLTGVRLELYFTLVGSNEILVINHICSYMQFTMKTVRTLFAKIIHLQQLNQDLICL